MKTTNKVLPFLSEKKKKMKATNLCSNTHMTRVTKKGNIDHDKILQKELRHHITYSSSSQWALFVGFFF